MRFHTIHVPAFEPVTFAKGENYLGQQVENIVPVKEGFCWPAFFFLVFWAFWHRLWLVAGSLIAFILVAHFLIVLVGASQVVTLLIGFGLATQLGYLANDFRRAKLKRNRYFERGIVIAPSADAAVRRYVSDLFKGR